MIVRSHPLDTTLIEPAMDWSGSRGARPTYGSDPTESPLEAALYARIRQAAGPSRASASKDAYGAVTRRPNYLAATDGQRPFCDSAVEPPITRPASSRQGHRGDLPAFRDTYGATSTIELGPAKVTFEGDDGIAGVFALASVGLVLLAVR